ncbi:cache domain-containing protein [Amphritea atlantica]|uniref:histidine kinase n=1 Tax=Amphritea atlantica TaxID=355243 RepID=A0ABY5GZ25_9GAMM|nr:cache domain-containing protein [Amphritea atlantica]
MFTMSKLFRRFFFIVLMIITMMFSAIYLYSVPLIQEQVFEIERNSARLALDNAFQLANKMHVNLENYREQALNAHKQRLKALVQLTEANLRQAYKALPQSGSFKNNRNLDAFKVLNHFSYDNDGYIWIADSQGEFITHPLPKFRDNTPSTFDTAAEKDILMSKIRSVIYEGEGFYHYKWQRLKDGPAAEKLTYIKYFPEWDLVIGSGLYLDDIETEVEQRKQNAITEVREALSQVRVAKTGYLFIFNKEGLLLTHPNSNIDQTNALSLRNPITGQPIVSELISVADTGQELRYKWDKPDDPGNYIYDKISLVRTLDGFGWYICSSVYVDELKHSSQLLSQRILTIALISTLLAICLAVFFISRITHPIKQLADTAERVRDGDLSAKSGIIRDDEIGLLAQTFDRMVTRLKSNIQTLDSKVKSRTLELAQLEERQRLILDALPAQIAYLDADLNYLFVNQGYADFFNKSKEEIINHPIGSILASGMMADIQDKVRRCLTGEKIVFEYQFKDRPVITKRMLIPDIDNNHNICGLVNLSLDITAEKDAERKLMEAQRMSATGQLAGGLAHDFNNLLSVILGNLLAATDHYKDATGLDRYLAPAIRASRRGADITGRLLSFARRQALTSRRVDLAILLPDTIELLQGSLPENIKIISTVSTPAIVTVDPNQLENAIINLALNARDAMPEGGEIGVSISACKLATDSAESGYDETVPAGEYVRLQVSDSGHGFTAQAMTQAYEPFYTTKSYSNGSGLGLSMVYGFIKQSRGFISIASTPGKGSAVTLLLPVNTQAEQPGDNTPPTAKLLSNANSNLTLLVEDDRDVRTIIRKQLISLGYAVIEAADSDEARNLIEALDHIDNLVSDISMPGPLNGLELADLMAEHHPAASIVLISGYAYDQLSDRSDLPCHTILKKPFSKEALKKAINSADKAR